MDITIYNRNGWSFGYLSLKYSKHRHVFWVNNHDRSGKPLVLVPFAIFQAWSELSSSAVEIIREMISCRNDVHVYVCDCKSSYCPCYWHTQTAYIFPDSATKVNYGLSISFRCSTVFSCSLEIKRSKHRSYFACRVTKVLVTLYCRTATCYTMFQKLIVRPAAWSAASGDNDRQKSICSPSICLDTFRSDVSIYELA